MKNKNETQTDLQRMIRVALVVILLFASLAFAYLAKPFLIPIAFGAFLAMLFSPLYNKLIDLSFPNWLSAGVCLLAFLLILAIAGSSVFFQVQSLSQNWSKIQKNLIKKKREVESFFIHKNGLMSQKEMNETQEEISKEFGSLTSVAKKIFGPMFSVLSNGLIAMAFLVLFLLQRERIFVFVQKLFPRHRREEIREGLSSSHSVASQYMIGKFVLVLTASVIYAASFTLLGLKYGILIGVICGFFTIIPYLGHLIGGSLVVLTAMATGGGTVVIVGPLIIILIYQLLESNIVEPWLLGSRVDMNPLFTLMFILGFSMMWGVAGTILAIPIGGITRVAFQHLKPVRPLAFVMGKEPIDE